MKRAWILKVGGE